MEKLCLGCMQMKKNEPVCEHCGFDERTENQPHQLPIGTILQNQYLIGRVLGQGGFGITYLGWDQHLSVPVAIKEYFPGGVVHRHTKLGSNVLCETGDTIEVFAKHRERFLKEARTLAQLCEIPEIVQIKTFFPENSTAYIVMEYVQGITLKQHLKQLGRTMTEQEALEIMKPVLQALQQVHNQKLIHRDISPDNIMIPASNEVKLIDFGTVRYIDDSGKSKSTEAVLKPGFAPIEQYNSKGNLGTWTDVYAICATFHYLLTGKIPSDVHDRLEEGENLPMLRNRENISARLVEILEKGMRIRVPDRIQTVEELYRMLYTQEEYASEEGKQQTDGKKKNSKKGLLAACAATVVAIGAAAVLLIPKNREPSHMPVTPEVPEATVQMEEPAALETLPSSEALAYQEAAAMEEAGEYGKAAIAFGKLGDYEDARERSFALWQTLPGRQTISLTARNEKKLLMLHGLRKDGTIAVECQKSDKITDEEIAQYPLTSYRDIVSIHQMVGLRMDGTLALPDSSFPYYEELSSWTELVAVSVPQAPYEDFFLGLKSDGTVVSVGSNKYGECDVAGWTNVVAIHAGEDCSFAVRSDGTVLANGRNRQGMCEIRDWTDIKAITSFDVMTYGLRNDGTIIGAGSDYTKAITVAESKKNVIHIDGPHIVKAGGDLPLFRNGWTDAVAVSWYMLPEGIDTVVLLEDGSFVFSRGRNGSFARTNDWTDIQPTWSLNVQAETD